MDERKRIHETREEEEKQAAAASSSNSAESTAEKAVFRTIGLDDEPDQIQYRSMAKTLSAAGPPALSRGGFMHAPMGGLSGPLAFASAPQKKGNMMAPSLKKKTDTTAPTFGVRVDRNKYVGVAPRDLPPPPFRLEMHTHFHAKQEAIQRVCGVVGRKLCELDTDFVFKADKCKWKVEYRRSGSALRVNLNIVIFKANNKEYVVEVQRREGDITALMHLYGELKMFFKRNQLLVEKSQPSNGMKRPAPKALPKTPLSSANISDAVLALKGLLESKFVDTQMQGVLGAISLSADEQTRSGMASLVSHLVALGQSKNVNVARLVGVALSRLCDHPECRQAFVASEGWQFIVDCAAGGADVNPEVQRESLHVVENLCPLYHDELAKAANATKVLQFIQDWQTIEDPRLKMHACNAHRALQEAGVIA